MQGLGSSIFVSHNLSYLVTLNYSIALCFILCVFHNHFRSADVHGLNGVLFAHSQTSLGGIPEQVLQGKWVQVQPLFLHRSSQERDEKKGLKDLDRESAIAAYLRV